MGGVLGPGVLAGRGSIASRELAKAGGSRNNYFEMIEKGGYILWIL